MQRWKKKFKRLAKITRDKDSLEAHTPEPVELDEHELKKYIDLVMREVKKEE